MKALKKTLKNIKIEDILCLFLIICPLLDIISFIFRNTFETNISPSTFIRPIIPIILFTIIFFKNKIKIQIIAISLIYGIYALLHIYIFSKIEVGCSYGSIFNELQYIVNYTFLIINLFIFTYLFLEKSNEKLKKSVLIAFGIYIVSIYISILTGTSSTTYIEGTGYKGWFESGNSLCTILCMSLCILLPMLKEKKYFKQVAVLIILAGIFLTTLVGTRTGLIGFGIIILLYIASECFVSLIQKTNTNKKIIGVSLLTVLLVVSIVAVGGSKTFERRNHLKEVQASATDIETGEKRFLSGDVTTLKNQIEAGEISEEYMPKEMQNAILRLYEYAKANNMGNNDMRKQQLVYNIYLVQEQKSIPLILFGNGYKAQFRELVMEMEVPAFLCNFGIFGFLLYFVPFLTIALYGIYIAIRKIKRIDTKYIMYLGGAWLAIFLSFLSGYTFFNSSSMIIVIAVYVLLINKILELKEKKA